MAREPLFFKIPILCVIILTDKTAELLVTLKYSHGCSFPGKICLPPFFIFNMKRLTYCPLLLFLLSSGFFFLSCLHVWNRKASSSSLWESGQGELQFPGESLTCCGWSDLWTLCWHCGQARPFFRRNCLWRSLGRVWLSCFHCRPQEDHFLQVNSSKLQHLAFCCFTDCWSGLNVPSCLV